MSSTQAPQLAPATGPAPVRPSGVGRKFALDGAALPFPGNTIVCHLNPDSDAYRALLVFRERLLDTVGSKVTWLPEASWHMTVFEGVCDQARVRSVWPADLGLDAPLEDCHKLFTERLSGRPLEEEPPYSCKFLGVSGWKGGIGLNIEVAGDGLRKVRNQLSEITGIRHQQHDTYGFHLSVAYALEFLSEEERKTVADTWREVEKEMELGGFELGAPEYCLFDSMFEFKRQFYLGA